MVRAADRKRRERFIAYVTQTYGAIALESRVSDQRRELQRRLGFESPGRLTQLLDPDQPFGERAAANAARRLKLPEDYFEREHDVVVHLATHAAAESQPGSHAQGAVRNALIALFDEASWEQQKAIISLVFDYLHAPPRLARHVLTASPELERWLEQHKGDETDVQDVRETTDVPGTVRGLPDRTDDYQAAEPVAKHGGGAKATSQTHPQKVKQKTRKIR